MKYSLGFIKVYTGEMVQYDAVKLQSMFLDYFNNYLTIDKFAEHNLLTRYEASSIIDEGFKAHEDIASQYKAGL